MRKRKALVSIPFNKITALASVAEGGMFRATSELVIEVGSKEYEFEFRGGEKRSVPSRVYIGSTMKTRPRAVVVDHSMMMP